MIKFVNFSEKQKKILTWWMPESPYRDYNGVIADGAIRSGKSTSFGMSFIMWAMSSFSGKDFALCGNTVDSFKRNIWFWLKPWCLMRGMKVFKGSKLSNGEVISNQYVIRYNGAENYFYIFGGHHEGSQKLIQGMTLAGCFLDEVALMPESFVNQATGRCSVDGAKQWFNCNPDAPGHFFKKNWIDRKESLRLYHLHFTQEDNPSLTDERKAFYRAQYVGIFFKRFILGLWAVAMGAIYDMWDEDLNEYDVLPEGLSVRATRYIGIDYGTTNPCVFIDCFDDGDTLWMEREYYWDSKDPATGARQKTDAQYADDLEAFISDYPQYPFYVIVDPSAASFKAELQNRGVLVKDADNDVIDGIRMTSTMIAHRKLKINRNRCKKTIEEFLGYVWDDKAAARGIEQPVKIRDHGIDGCRYLVKTIIPTWRLTT